MKTVIAVFSGATLATAFILACSDDSPADVDAAVCDCPAGEPPVPTRLTVVEGSPESAAPGSALAIALCPTGAKVISGGCFVDEAAANDITISGFGKLELGGQEGHECRWYNNHSQAQMVHAEATCLVPAP